MSTRDALPADMVTASCYFISIDDCVPIFYGGWAEFVVLDQPAGDSLRRRGATSSFKWTRCLGEPASCTMRFLHPVSACAPTLSSRSHLVI